ncbi:hypothetical protein MKY96_33240 [Paenibacillus sp. FSL R7-0302]
MEFRHDEGKIFCIVEGMEIDVTETVMNVVDDYLDFKLGLHEWSQS